MKKILTASALALALALSLSATSSFAQDENLPPVLQGNGLVAGATIAIVTTAALIAFLEDSSKTTSTTASP